ncbi:hypothetical protein M9H77_12956 [Catharanthus roseus]|uniref:Uncharacterized protein n=1 Tax=Catharanthus roseus TaxID=4058 RepID=A0ACC0BIV7_CATRO|nr:hypothetical protein M9H77_12956 [Catharanthus roseus]
MENIDSHIVVHSWNEIKWVQDEDKWVLRENISIYSHIGKPYLYPHLSAQPISIVFSVSRYRDFKQIQYNRDSSTEESEERIQPLKKEAITLEQQWLLLKYHISAYHLTRRELRFTRPTGGQPTGRLEFV